jgi:hypothetical protein
MKELNTMLEQHRAQQLKSYAELEELCNANFAKLIATADRCIDKIDAIKEQLKGDAK